MGSTTVNKKRKLRDSELATASASTKKSKKVPAPPPSDSDSDEEDEIEAAAANDSDDVVDDAEDAEEGGSELGDGKDLGDDVGENAAPLLPPTTTSNRFEDMNLSEKTMKAIQDMGFTKMTQIQQSVSLAHIPVPSIPNALGQP